MIADKDTKLKCLALVTNLISFNVVLVVIWNELSISSRNRISASKKFKTLAREWN